MSIAERLALSPELRDTEHWDRPRESDIREQDLENYRTRKNAIIAYLNGVAFASIRKDYGLSKHEIYRMLDRCFASRPNGTMYGFHGLIPGIVIAPYRRTKPIDPELAASSKGFAGAFIQLMSEHEKLRLYVEKYALSSVSRSAKTVAKAIHSDFLKRCARFRAPNQYPFTTDDQGSRALSRFVDRIRTERYANAKAGEENDALEIKEPLTAQPSGAQRLRPFEETEHDGHNGDFYFVIKTRGRRGEWIYTTPMRLWLLILFDRASRSILGYSYRLGSTNYPAIAVMRSFVHALTPWKPKEITLPHLAYKDGAGFASGIAPRSKGRLPDLVLFDSAKANTASATIEKLSRVLGATINFGRVGTPTARPFIERLNQTLETQGFRRLPIGFNPKAGNDERKRAFEAASAYAVTEDELDQVIDVMLANHNADPHEELANRTPNEFIRMWDSQTASPLRRVENPEQLAESLLRMEYVKTIRGGGDTHRAPYIELWGARYTNDVLRKMKDSVGKSVRLVVDIDGDIRFVRAFLRRGKAEHPLGILKAGPPWHLTPHTLEQRQIVQRSHRIKKLVVKPGTDMLQTFKHLRQREAEERKSAVNQLVRAGKLATPQNAASKRDAKARVAPKDWIKLK